jgi:hypothetical protein
MYRRKFTIIKIPSANPLEFISVVVGPARFAGRREDWMKMLIGDQIILADLAELRRAVEWCEHRHEILRRRRKG